MDSRQERITSVLVLIFLALLLAGIAAGTAWLYVTGGNVP
jgi:D-alanyl-lipoteichoic acid acyltransferase DltB (MBOAT superfamily)